MAGTTRPWSASRSATKSLKVEQTNNLKTCDDRTHPPFSPRQISFTIPARDSFVFRTSISIAAIPTSGSTLAPSRMGANE